MPLLMLGPVLTTGAFPSIGLDTGIWALLLQALGATLVLGAFEAEILFVIRRLRLFDLAVIVWATAGLVC